MSKLRYFYVEKMGQNYNLIKNSPWYLAELSLCGAKEIDDCLLKRSNDFSHIKELEEVLGEYQLKDTDTALTEPSFPYLLLWRAIKKRSDKNIESFSELALEIRLLRFELKDISNNPKKLKELRSFLCDLSEEFSYGQDQYDHPSRLIA